MRHYRVQHQREIGIEETLFSLGFPLGVMCHQSAIGETMANETNNLFIYQRHVSDFCLLRARDTWQTGNVPPSSALHMCGALVEAYVTHRRLIFLEGAWSKNVSGEARCLPGLGTVLWGHGAKT